MSPRGLEEDCGRRLSNRKWLRRCAWRLTLDLLHFSIGVRMGNEHYHPYVGREKKGGAFRYETNLTTYPITNTGVHHSCDNKVSLPCAILHTLLECVLEPLLAGL